MKNHSFKVTKYSGKKKAAKEQGILVTALQNHTKQKLEKPADIECLVTSHDQAEKRLYAKLAEVIKEKNAVHLARIAELLKKHAHPSAK